jgi:hypothetical protein
MTFLAATSNNHHKHQATTTGTDLIVGDRAAGLVGLVAMSVRLHQGDVACDLVWP